MNKFLKSEAYYWIFLLINVFCLLFNVWVLTNGLSNAAGFGVALHSLLVVYYFFALRKFWRNKKK